MAARSCPRHPRRPGAALTPVAPRPGAARRSHAARARLGLSSHLPRSPLAARSAHVGLQRTGGKAAAAGRRARRGASKARAAGSKAGRRARCWRDGGRQGAGSGRSMSPAWRRRCWGCLCAPSRILCEGEGLLFSAPGRHRSAKFSLLLPPISSSRAFRRTLASTPVSAASGWAAVQPLLGRRHRHAVAARALVRPRGGGGEDAGHTACAVDWCLSVCQNRAIEYRREWSAPAANFGEQLRLPFLAVTSGGQYFNVARAHKHMEAHVGAKRTVRVFRQT